LLIAGAIGAGWFYVDIRDKREELTTRRMDLDETRVRLEKLRISVQSQRLDMIRLKERINLLESLEHEKFALEPQNSKGELELASLRKQLAMAVKEERLKAVGTVHPELRLTDGEVLTGARIVSVSDFAISVAHAGGVSRIPAQRLPTEIQERFRFGIDMSGDIEAPPAGNTLDSLQRTATSRLTDAQRRKVMTLNETLAAKKNRLQALEKMGAEESPPQPQESKPLPKSPEQQRIQRERDMQRHAVAQNVNRAALAARAREIESLRKEIPAIEAEIALLYKEAQ
jgi:hypothetical protein